MAPTVIVLALLALGVGIVAFATRRPARRPDPLPNDQDTTWADPDPSSQADPSASPLTDAPAGPGSKASS